MSRTYRKTPNTFSHSKSGVRKAWKRQMSQKTRHKVKQLIKQGELESTEVIFDAPNNTWDDPLDYSQYILDFDPTDWEQRKLTLK